MSYKVIPHELRNAFKESWRGFDLTGKKVGDTFLGCEECGVQTDHGFRDSACVDQCPNCLKTMFYYTVTAKDLL